MNAGQRGKLDGAAWQRRRATSRDPLGVIKGDVLLLRPGHRVVVLPDAHGFREALQACVAGGAADRPDLPHDLQKRAALPDVALQGRTRREIAGPERVRLVGVREKIVCLQGPSHGILAGLRGHIPLWTRVHGGDAAVCVHMLDDAIEVVKPFVRVLVLEIRAHGEHDVGAPRLVRLIHRFADEIVHPSLDVVILQIGIVLHGVVVA
mmetsp:Transcript_68889/g.211298  ORF Transcript_68889/g.211298 Transcript_68889/m.211298 type:complete len:207 (-) Transcript_68889:787-1407(-)